MADSCDYPAAHSMDTAWFAVDADGNVGFFDSGEAGAVPKNAFLEEDYYDIVDRLHKELPLTDVVYHLEGRRSPVPEYEELHVKPFDDRPLRVLMFLKSADAARTEIDAGVGEIVPSSTGVAVLFDELPRTAHDRLHAEQACLACFHDWQPEDEGDIAETGLFHYSHACENWIAGPYGLLARPQQPVNIARISKELGGKVVKFPGRFGETEMLQPVEFWKCESWGPAWLSRDGKAHPFEGRESEYAESYQAEATESPQGVTWTPPAGAQLRKKPWWKFW